MCVHIDTQSGGFGSDEAHFALQTGVECRAAEHKMCLVRLRWRTHEGEVVLSLPMGLEEEKAEEEEGVRRLCRESSLTRDRSP